MVCHWSPHLYGEKTPAKVAAHAREIVSGLPERCVFSVCRVVVDEA